MKHLSLILFLFLCWSCAQVDTADEEAIPAETTFTTDILRDFRKDKTAAAKKYGGKLIEIAGTIGKISQRKQKTIVILHDGDPKKGRTPCIFNDDQAAGIARLQPGKMVRVKGTGEYNTSDDYTLKGCTVVLPVTIPEPQVKYEVINLTFNRRSKEVRVVVDSSLNKSELLHLGAYLKNKGEEWYDNYSCFFYLHTNPNTQGRPDAAVSYRPRVKEVPDLDLKGEKFEILYITYPER